MIATTLHLLQNPVCDSRCGAFSIAFDATSHRENADLHARIRAVIRNEFTIVHFLAILSHDSHAGLLDFEVVRHVLDAVFRVCWQNKLVFVTTAQLMKRVA